jgi:rhodanese-related sulfurtransferase
MFSVPLDLFLATSGICEIANGSELDREQKDGRSYVLHCKTSQVSGIVASPN